MDKWLRDRLSNCLDFEVPEDMIKYILSIKTSKEFDDYFESLLNTECEDHRHFLSDCKQRLFSKALPNKKNSDTNITAQNKKAQASHGSAPIKQHSSASNMTGQQPSKSPEAKASAQTAAFGGAKKKSKYVNLYSSDGKVLTDTILLKGRRLCECQASQHKLINNCLGCGRIVCEQEGSGPCLFCGEIVCSNEERQILQGSNAKKSDLLMRSLKEKGGGGEGLKKAMEQRDRLLEYDRNSEKRTTVIDDELDYFQENSVWLSEAEREKFEQLKHELHERKHAGRAKRSIKVDFAGREVDESAIADAFEQNVLQQVAQATKADDSNWSNRKHSQKSSSDDCNADPMIDVDRPIYKATAEGRKNDASQLKNDGLERIYNRVQDKELMEMQDMRQCLSMHQPWASLLVAGVKKHEGRIWYSEHRGRLWIASTVKEPRPEEIKELENYYKRYYNDDSIEFPQHYPTGCLLGCVKVTDCLAQEEYREIYPQGESDSPYVFVCSNPEPLPVVFPIKGQHKIYQIDPKVHNAACKTLLRLRAK